MKVNFMLDDIAVAEIEVINGKGMFTRFENVQILLPIKVRDRGTDLLFQDIY